MSGIESLTTSVKCAGKCGESIDMLKAHLAITVKTQKLALVLPPQTSRADGEDVEEDEDISVSLGTRAGVGEQLYFHNGECAAKYFSEAKGKAVKLKLNTDEDDPYAEAAKVMHGSDEEEGDEE